MTDTDLKFDDASTANISDNDFNKATENFNWAKDHPDYKDDHERVERFIKEAGLDSHREVLEYYKTNKMPMPMRMLRLINAYKDTTYYGPFDRGKAKASPKDRPAAKPRRRTAAEGAPRRSIKPGAKTAAERLFGGKK